MPDVRVILSGSRIRLVQEAEAVNDIPVVTPGAGWAGLTETPAAEGSSSDRYYSETPIALWNVIPDVYTGSCELRLFATHGTEGGVQTLTGLDTGIDRVEMAVNDGPWVEADWRIDPTTGLYFWTARLVSSATSGLHIPRAKVYPVNGEPVVLQSLTWEGDQASGMMPRASTDPTEVIYCATTGSDITGDGTSGNPYGPDVTFALSEVGDGGAVEMMDDGEYTVDAVLPDVTTTRYVTLRAPAGVTAWLSVTDGLATGFHPGFTWFSIENVGLRMATFATFQAGTGRKIRLKQPRWDFVDWYREIPGQLLPFVTEDNAHFFIEDGEASNALYGFCNADIVRNCTLDHVSTRPLVWTRFAVGCTVTNFAVAGKTVAASNSGGDLLLTYSGDDLHATEPKSVLMITSGTLPTGLSLATTYYVKRQSATTCKVATSYANANAGTFIAYTDAGSGTHTMTLNFHGDLSQTYGGDPGTGLLNNRILYGVNSGAGCAEQTIMRLTGDYWPGVRNFSIVECDFSSFAEVPPGNFGGPPYMEWTGNPNGAVGGTNGSISGTTLTLNETKDFSAYTGTCFVTINTPSASSGADRSWFTVASFNPSAAACTSITLVETATASRTGRTWKVGGQLSSGAQSTWPGGFLRHIVIRGMKMPTQRLSIYGLAEGKGMNRSIVIDGCELHHAQYDAYIGSPSAYPEGTEFRNCTRGAE